MNCFLIGFGLSLPTRVVVNEEIAALLGGTPECIEANPGIREPRYVTAEQSTSDLAVAAVRDALADARVHPTEIDYLIACTLLPDFQVPGIAPIVQHKLA